MIEHDIETGVSGCPRDKSGGCPLTGQVVSGMKATRAWSAAAVRNVGRPALIRPPLGWREGDHRAAETVRWRVPMRGGLADWLVVAQKLL